MQRYTFFCNIPNFRRNILKIVCRFQSSEIYIVRRWVRSAIFGSCRGAERVIPLKMIFATKSKAKKNLQKPINYIIPHRGYLLIAILLRFFISDSDFSGVSNTPKNQK